MCRPQQSRTCNRPECYEQEQEQSLLSNISVPRLFFATPCLSPTADLLGILKRAHALTLSPLCPRYRGNTLPSLHPVKVTAETRHCLNLCCVDRCYLYVLSLSMENSLSWPLTEFTTCVIYPHPYNKSNETLGFNGLHGTAVLMSTKTFFSSVSSVVRFLFVFKCNVILCFDITDQDLLKERHSRGLRRQWIPLFHPQT